MENGRQEEAAFGERFAQGQAAGMLGLALFTLVSVVMHGSMFPFIASAGVLAMSHGFRRRFAAEEKRRSRALEDERDHAITAHGNQAFRFAASAWMVGLGIALAVPALREPLLAVPLRVPGLLLLGVMAANVAGHAAVAWLYRRDRQGEAA